MIFYIIFLFILNLRYDFIVKSPFIIFTIISYLLYILSFFFHIDSYPEWVSLDVSYLGASFFSILFIFRLLFNSVLNKGKILFKHNVNEVELYYYNKVLFLLSLVVLVLVLYRFDFNISKALFSSWADNRQMEGYTGLISLYLYYVSSSLLLISILRKNTIMIFYSIFLSVFITLSLKSRGYIVAMFLPIILYYILHSNFNFKKYIFIFFGGGGGLFLYVFIRYIRWIGGVQNLDLLDFNLSVMLGEDFAELDLIRILYDTIEKNNYYSIIHDDFLSIKRILFMLVPDFIYSKPDNLSYVLWNYKTGILDVSGSYHPTIVAEAYFNHHQYGVFIYAFFLAIFFSCIEFLFRKNNVYFIFLSGAFCFFITALARGSSYNAFVVFLFSVFCLLVFTVIRKVRL